MADFWFTESVRVRDGAAASLLGAKVFEARRRQKAHLRAQDWPRNTPPPLPKSFAILEAG